MIFSLSKSKNIFTLNLDFDGDIFCYFSVAGSIHCPEALELNCLLSSLRMKRPVLILSELLPEIPGINPSKRWDLGDNWIWIAPRAHGHLADNLSHLSPDFVLLKTFLIISN